MNNSKEIPVLLLTGYLGSGKTTLVNHILSNNRGIKFAVIVNDIGEVNIDARLIEKGGIVGKKDDSLVALQNGCICCTLKMDLVQQIYEIAALRKFDYIVIEASGICEPEPIAQTICSIPQLDKRVTRYGVPRLDNIVTVVDALRLRSEFGCGDELARENIDEEDIENLIIQQIEFCNTILLNKVSEVAPDDIAHIKAVLKALQPAARVIEADYAAVDLDELLDTHAFDLGRTMLSAGWVREIDRQATPEEEDRAKHPHHHHHDDDHDDDHDHDHDHDHDDHDEHEAHHHHHHHHHDHEGGEVEEYGISTFVYYRRPAFDLNKFDYYVASKWPAEVIRAKGVCYFSDEKDMSYIFEQAGVQKKLTAGGQWYASAPEHELMAMVQQQPDIMRDWDDRYGDRMIKIVFIGRNLNREQIARDLDACLE
ncbi:MAG: CobW family GTP-binding protein [Muribaculaceae bacterium]